MRIVDVTGANRRDLIYAGPSGCDEGSLTLVWQDYLAADVRPPLEISGIALRIAVEADPVFLSFIGGCCADPMNEFVLRRPLPLRRRMWLDSVRVHNTLLLPDGIVADRRDIVFDREFVLRRAPVEDDAYDEAASGFHGHAVFGTGLRKFMPGVTARQLGRFRDEAGSVFALVRVDREAGAKAIYSVVPIDVGWVRVGGQ